MGDSDCQIGSCNSTSLLCLTPSKECLNNCSGNGACLFTDSDNNEISVCEITNNYCWTNCLCDDEWSGTDCSFSDEDYEDAVNMTSLVIDSISTSYGDVLATPDLISSTSSTIVSVLTQSGVDVSDLDDEAVDGIVDVLDTLASDMLSLGDFDADTADNIMDSFSAIVEGDLNSGDGGGVDSDTSEAVVSSMDTLTEAAMNNLEVGEEGVSISSSTLESYTVIEYTDTVLASTIQSSGATSESYDGSGGGFETSSDFGLDGSDDLGITFSEFFWNTRVDATSSDSSNISVNSNILRLGLQSDSLDSSNRRRLLNHLSTRFLTEDSSSTFYLTSGDDLSESVSTYSSNNTENVTYTVSCDWDEFETKNVTCPDGSIESYVCEGIQSEYTLTCSGLD